jgi:hypothetical protein
LALVSGDQCVLRYDNERGKGDHIDDQECALTFSSMPQLLIDFDPDIQYCWRRSQSGIGSGASSQAGGPRAGVIGGS